MATSGTRPDSSTVPDGSRQRPWPVGHAPVRGPAQAQPLSVNSGSPPSAPGSTQAELYAVWLTRGMVGLLLPPFCKAVMASGVQQVAPYALPVPQAREMLAQAALARPLPDLGDLRRNATGALRLLLRETRGRHFELGPGRGRGTEGRRNSSRQPMARRNAVVKCAWFAYRSRQCRRNDCCKRRTLSRSWGENPVICRKLRCNRRVDSPASAAMSAPVRMASSRDKMAAVRGWPRTCPCFTHHRTRSARTGAIASNAWPASCRLVCTKGNAPRWASPT